MLEEEFDNKLKYKWAELDVKIIHLLQKRNEHLGQTPTETLSKLLKSAVLLEEFEKADFINKEIEKRKSK